MSHAFSEILCVAGIEERKASPSGRVGAPSSLRATAVGKGIQDIILLSSNSALYPPDK